MLDYDNELYWFLAVNNEIFDGYTSGGSRDMELKLHEGDLVGVDIHSG